MDLEIKNKQQPIEDFKRIANYLMNDAKLLVGEQGYRFTSLEFYYLHPEHADVYSHKHLKQTTTRQWYFHGSGLDITFGSDGVYGGILIRGLKRLGDKPGYINGPLLCVQEIFSALGAVDNQEQKQFFIADLPWDRTGSLITPETVYQSRRVGLNEKTDTSEGSSFYNGLYRFFINPKETQKDKGAIAADLRQQGFSEQQINELVGYKHFK